VLFLHGNGDHAALWLTTLWRFESNGWPRERLMAVNFPDPLARDDDAVAQANRSSSAEQTERLAGFLRELRGRSGAARVALVANSRGGYPVRDFVVHRGGAAEVSHAVLCGTPNRGVYDWPEIRNREFNSASDFLRRMNGGDSDVVPGTAFMTIRSDANDLFAQPRAVWNQQAPDRPTGTDVDGPELRGATNRVLPGLDHREVAYHWRAFAEMFPFIAGRAPARLDVVPEARPVLNGLVTGVAGGQQTNRPVEGATLEIFRTDPDTGVRMGEADPSPHHGRGWRLGAGDGRARLDDGMGAGEPGPHRHAHLPVALPALLRRDPPAPGARTLRGGARGGRRRGADDAPARLFRAAARRDLPRRAGARGHPPRRGARGHDDAPPARRRCRAPRHRPVQRGAHRRARLARRGGADHGGGDDLVGSVSVARKPSTARAMAGPGSSGVGSR
jgi:hypothetical protein